MGNPVVIQLLSGATPTWDALYKFAKITASGNTAITISGAGTPDAGILHFKQDATGSRTLTINGTSITVKTAAGSITRVDWAYDGEDYTYATNVTGGASGGGSTYTPTYTPAYVSALFAEGETMPTAHQDAFTAFEETLDTAGILPKIKQFLPFYGANVTRAMIDFMGFRNAVNGGGTVASADGLICNGSSAYVNTQIVPSTDLIQHNVGMTVKMANNTTPADERFGCYVFGTGQNPMLQMALNFNGTQCSFVAGSDGSYVNFANPTDFSVPMTAVRRTSTDMEAYVNGVSVGTDTNAVTVGLPTNAGYSGASHANTMPEKFVNNTIQVHCYHEGLTSAEVATLHSAINDLMTGIGR